MYLGAIIPNIRRIYEGTGTAWESYILVHCALLSLSGFYAGSDDTGGGTYRKFVSDFFPSQYAGSDLWKDLRLLKGSGDSLSRNLVTFQRSNIFPFVKYPSRSRPIEPRNQVKRGRLAGPVWTDETQDLFLMELHVQIFDSCQASEVDG